MKIITLVNILAIFTLSIQLTNINFTFPRTIYVKKNSNKKVIKIISPEIESMNIKLYISSNSTNESEKYIECGQASNNTSIFHCIITNNGSYDFRYKVNDEQFQYLKEKIYVYNSFDEIFTFSISRNTKCYYYNETFSYTLERLKGINVDYNSIQIFAYYPKSILKNITDPIVIELNRTNNEYFFKSNNLTMRQYEIRVTQNNDTEDYLGIIDKITFTDVFTDEYFYPDLKKIKFKTEYCNFKPSEFVLMDENGKDYKITCNKNSIYYDSGSLFCYFDEEINYYGKMNVYFGDALIGDNIFSSRTFSQVNFTGIIGEDIINGNKYITYSFFDEKNEFYLDSINKLYVKLNDGLKTNIHVYERNINDETDAKLSLENNKLIIKILYQRGYNYTIIKLERKIFEDENINFAYDVYQFINKQINEEPLEKIKFEPDFVIMNDENYNYTKLVFPSSTSNNEYGDKFCSYYGGATNVFYCNSSYNDYKIIYPYNHSSPGFIYTQLGGYTYQARLKVIKIEVQNTCQGNIFGIRDNLDDAQINVYYPLDGENFITVKYNGKEIKKNQNLKINYNPFNCTFESFIIPKNELVQGENIAIFYEGINIKNITFNYANVSIPTFVQRQLFIDSSKNPSNVKIRFSKPMTIGVNEVKFILKYQSYSIDCNLEDNNTILNCPNPNTISPKQLYYYTNCESGALDFQINYYNEPKDSYEVSNYYILLPGNQKSVTFYWKYKSPLYNFPYKVYINDKEIIHIKTEGNNRYYYYTTYGEGEYQFSYLDYNKNNRSCGNDCKVYVKKNLSDFFINIGLTSKCIYLNEIAYLNLQKQTFVKGDKLLVRRDNYSETQGGNLNYPIQSGNVRNINVYVFSKNILNYLYHDVVTITSASIDRNTYSLNKIVINNLICPLKGLHLINSNTGKRINLICDEVLRNGKLYCDTSETLEKGQYNLYSSIYIGNTFISVSIETADFIVYPYSTSIGQNPISINSEDFYMDTILKIILKDNDGTSVVFSRDTLIDQEINKFSFNENNNEITLTIVAHPGKNYNIQLFNEKGSSKIYELTKNKEDIIINIDKPYYYNATFLSLPKITISGGFASQIKNIYFKNERKNETFNNENILINGKNTNNNYIAEFSPKEIGTYVFAYSLKNDGDVTKYSILNKKIIVGEEYYDFILFLPLPDFILSTKDFCFDIIPKYKMDLETYLSNQNNNPIVYFDHKKGQSNYDLTTEKMSSLNNGQNYLLVIKDKISNMVLFTQNIIYKIFLLDKVYFNLGYIIIYNSTKIPDLFFYSDNFGFNTTEYQEILDNDLIIAMPEETGYYSIFYEDEFYGKFFYTNNLYQASFIIFPISGKNNVLIFSKDYYLPYINEITVEVKDNNEIIDELIYLKENITYKDNDYIKISLPEYHNKQNEKPIYIITKINGISINPFEGSEEPYLLSLPLKEILIYDEPINFNLLKNYQIISNNKENITFLFDINENITVEELQSIMSKIYINGELKIFNIEKSEGCDFSNLEKVTCSFIYPSESTQINITYNEFEETEQIYTYFIYDYEGDDCIIKGNDKSYKFEIGNLPYDIYINETKLEENEKGIYYITENNLKYGKNIIKVNYNNEFIPLTIINYYPLVQYYIYDKTITPTLEGISFQIYTNYSSFIDEQSNLISLYKRNLTDGLIDPLTINQFILVGENEYNGLGDLTGESTGQISIIEIDQCQKEHDLGIINIVDFNRQILISISPQIINIHETKNYIVTLTYNQNFSNDSIPIGLSLINKNNKKIEQNKVFDIGVKDNIIIFDISSDFISLINPGNYYIKLLFQNEEKELISSETITFIKRLSLYNTKQQIVKSDKLIKIGAIFTNDFTLEQIENVTYNKEKLEYSIHEKYQNILIMNTTNINLSKEGNFIFSIYEKNINEPLIYTLQTINGTGGISDIIFTHYINIKTNNGYAYITISVNDNIIAMNYSINNENNMNYKTLSQIWSNTFVLITDDIEDSYFIFKYNDDINNNITYKEINKKIYVIKDKSSFIPNNFNPCQVNYCLLDDHLENNQCFKDLILKPLNYYEIDTSYTQLYYALYSLSKNTTYKFNISNNIPNLEANYSDNHYILQIIRKDLMDSEPIILFQEEITLTNLTYIKNSLIYDNEYFQFKYTSICEVDDNFTLKDTIKNECYPDDNERKCLFELVKNISNNEFILKFNDYNLTSPISIYPKEFTYEISVTDSLNGKAKFQIYITNINYNSFNIIGLIFIDNITNSSKLEIGSNRINYDSNSAYVEIAKDELSKEIYLYSIILNNNLTYYNISGKNGYTFNKVQSVTPLYHYSYKDNNDLNFIVEGEFNSIYLKHGISENKVCEKKVCNAKSIEYGLDYIINNYDNIVIHTIKYNFGNKCQSEYDKKTITFNLYSECEIPDIENIEILVFNYSDNKPVKKELKYIGNNSKDNQNIYQFSIDPKSLSTGDYYISFNNTNFTETNFSIVNGQFLKKITGDIYSKIQNQYFILEFYYNFTEDDLINTIMISKENEEYHTICDLLLDNPNSILCKIQNSILNSGNYTIKYMHKCGEYFILNKNLIVKENSIGIPISETIKYDINSPKAIHISFSSNLNISNDINSIKLIKTDFTISKEINISSSEIISDFSFSITNIDLGNYLFNFTYSSNDIVIIPYLIVYDSNFDIKDHGPFISLTEFTLEKVSIKFKGRYHHNQIKKVYLIEDMSYNGFKTDITKNSNFDNESYSLIFKSYENKNSLNQYHIEMVGDINTYIYYLHYIGNPINNKLYNMGEIDLTKNNIYLRIHNTFSVYFCDLINEIKSDNDLIFMVHFCPKEYLLIGIDHSKTQPKLDNPNSFTTNINIIYSNNQTITIPSNNIYTKEFYTKDFKNIKGKTYQSYFMDNYYYGLIPLTDLNSQNMINFIKVFPFTDYFNYWENNNTFIFQYKLYEEVKDSHSILIRDSSNYNNYIEFTFNLITCDDNLIYDISYLNSKISCITCKSKDPNNPYKSKNSNLCTNECLPGYYSYNDECYTNCSQINSTIPLFEEENKCVYSCKENYGRENNKSTLCYECESINKKVNEDGLCKSCLEDWCEIKEEIIPDKIIDLCENVTCGNETETDISLIGTCFIEDDEAKCLCPSLFKGGDCLINKIEEILEDFGLNEEEALLKPGNGTDDLIINSNENENDTESEPIINIESNKAMEKVKTISSLVKSTKVVQTIKPKTIKTLFHTVGTTITKMLDGFIDMNSNIIFLYDLATNLVKTTLEIKKNKRLRYLFGKIRYLDENEYSLDINQFLNMVKNAGGIYKKLTLEEIKNGLFNETSMTYDFYEERGIHYRKWTNNKESLNKLYSILEENSTFISSDLSSCVSNDKNIVFITIIIPNDTYSLVKNEININQTNTIGFNFNDGSDINITECTNITTYFPLNINDINESKYKIYINKNIDIYKSYEEIVQKTCYITKDFDYDLTQKFRRTQIYENKTFYNYDQCKYDSLNLDTLQIKMYCNYIPEFKYEIPYLENMPLNEALINKLDILTFKCLKEINNLQSNIGFWLFLIMIILTIILNIILLLTNKNKKCWIRNDINENDKGYKIDEINNNVIENKCISNESSNSNNEENIDNKIENQSKSQDLESNNENINNKKNYEFKIKNYSLGNIFKDNLFYLHPILILFKHSIIYPLNLKIIFFTFHVFLIYGINAILYFETIIEKRIYNNSRNKIYYPLSKEFTKLIYSILLSMLTTFILKLIILITIEQRDRVKNKINTKQENKREEGIKEFNKDVRKRRIISIIIIIIISVFLFYYVIAFCSIYSKTQFNWFISGIWCLIFEWIILSPFYIFIISLIQNSNNEEVTFYMKKLFIF